METGELQEKLTELKRLGELGLITGAQVLETTNQLLKVFATPKKVLQEQNEQMRKIQLLQGQQAGAKSDLDAPVTPHKPRQRGPLQHAGMAAARGLDGCTARKVADNNNSTPRAALQPASSSHRQAAQPPGVIREDLPDITRQYRPSSPIKLNSQRAVSPVDIVAPCDDLSEARPSDFSTLKSNFNLTPAGGSSRTPADAGHFNSPTKAGLDRDTQPSAVPSTPTPHEDAVHTEDPQTSKVHDTGGPATQTILVRAKVQEPPFGPVDQGLFDALKRHLQDDSFPSAAADQGQHRALPQDMAPVPAADNGMRDVQEGTSVVGRQSVPPIKRMSSVPIQESSTTGNAQPPAFDLRDVMKQLGLAPAASSGSEHTAPLRWTEPMGSLPQARLVSSLAQRQPMVPSEDQASLEALGGDKSQTVPAGDLPSVWPATCAAQFQNRSAQSPTHCAKDFLSVSGLLPSPAGRHESNLEPKEPAPAVVHPASACQLPTNNASTHGGRDCVGQPDAALPLPQAATCQAIAQQLDIQNMVHTLFGHAVAAAGIKPGRTPVSVLQALATASRTAPADPAAPSTRQMSSSPPEALPPSSAPKGAMELRSVVQKLREAVEAQQAPQNQLPAQMPVSHNAPAGCAHADCSMAPEAVQQHHDHGSTPQAPSASCSHHPPSVPSIADTSDHHLQAHVKRHPDLSEVFHEIFSEAEPADPHPQSTSDFMPTDPLLSPSSGPPPCLYTMLGEAQQFDPLIGFAHTSKPHDSPADPGRDEPSGRHAHEVAPTQEPLEPGFPLQMATETDHQQVASQNVETQQSDTCPPASVCGQSVTPEPSMFKPNEPSSPSALAAAEPATTSQPSTPPSNKVTSTAPVALGSPIRPPAVTNLKASATPGNSCDDSSSESKSCSSWTKLAECRSREAAEKWLNDTGLVYICGAPGEAKEGDTYSSASLMRTAPTEYGSPVSAAAGLSAAKGPMRGSICSMRAKAS